MISRILDQVLGNIPGQESHCDIPCDLMTVVLEVDKLVFETSDSDMSLTLIRIQTKNQIRANGLLIALT